MVFPNIGIIGMTESASKISTLSGDIRGVFDLAVLNKKPYRMVFAFNSGDYWVETTDRTDVFVEAESLERELSEEEIAERQAEFDELLEEYKDLAGVEVHDDENDRMIPPTSPLVKNFEKLKPIEWTKIDDPEFRGRTLGPYFVVQDMQAEHHSRLIRLEEYQDQARGYLYFFPHGYVERAVIHVTGKLGEYEIDPNEVPYTITTKPYEGVASVESGYKEVNIFEDQKRK